MESQQNIRIRFVATQEEYKVDDVAVAVPVNLGRQELAQIVCHLLGLTEESDQISFAFEHDNSKKLLTTSVLRFCQKHDISFEDELILNFFPPTPPPQQNNSVSTGPEWLSCVDASVESEPGVSCLLAGSYSGAIQMYSLNTQKGKLIPVEKKKEYNEFQIHAQPIKCVKQIKFESTQFCLSGARDGSINFSGVDHEKAILEPLRILKCHSSSVETIDAVEDNDCIYVASGSWDKNIGVFKFEKSELNDASEFFATSLELGSKSKRKAPTTLDEKIPESVLSEHSDKISAVCFGKVTSQNYSRGMQLFSASNDHTIKLWDDLKNMLTFNCKKVPTALDFNSDSNLLVSAHVDSAVRVWDVRSNSGNMLLRSLKSTSGHNSWVSSVKWSNRNENELFSSDYDGTIVQWDVRSNVPLQTMEHVHESKCLGIDVDQSRRCVISVGADAALRVHFRS